MRRFLMLFLCAAVYLALFAVPAQGEALNHEGFLYELQADGTARITGYEGNSQELAFPSSLDGYTVTAIGDFVMKYNYTVGSVLLPETVISIGSRAFHTAFGLKNIFVIPGNNVYESVGGVLYKREDKMLCAYPIGRWSDHYAVRNGTRVIGEYAFFCNFSLTSVELPDSLLEIGGNAFEQCVRLKELILPRGLEKIGDMAFFYCSALERMTIPASVKEIGERALSRCIMLDEILVEEGNLEFSFIDGVLFDISGKRLIVYPGARKEKAYAIPEGTETVEADAFSENSYLQKVTIPASVSTIGGAAFGNCASLREIAVDEGNGIYAAHDGILFDTNASRLEAYPAGKKGESYAVPDGTLAIGENAFERCLLLRDIQIPDSVLLIAEAAFWRCESLKALTLPKVMDTIEKGTFSECYSLAHITLPSGIREIKEEAFSESGLCEITLPDGLELVGIRAFRSCYQLMSVYLPASVTYIADDAFLWSYYPIILELEKGSLGQSFAMEKGMAYMLHPDWLPLSPDDSMN